MEETLELPLETVMVSTYDGLVGVGRIEINVRKNQILKCVASGRATGFAIIAKGSNVPCSTVLDHRYRRAYKNEALKWVR